MTDLLADIAHIEKLHQVAEANGDTSFEHHMRATLLRAYRELAGELEAVSKSWVATYAAVEQLTLELQVSTQQAGELRDERGRLRAYRELAQELDKWQSPSSLAVWNELLGIGEPAHGNKPLQVAAAVALLKGERDHLRSEVERLTQELDHAQRVIKARGDSHRERDQYFAEAERLRASHVKVFEAGWRTAATWAVRADLIFDIGSPAYLEDQAKALVNAQHPEQQPADACQHERLKCEPDESRIYCADCGVFVRHTP